MLHSPTREYLSWRQATLMLQNNNIIAVLREKNKKINNDRCRISIPLERINAYTTSATSLIFMILIFKNLDVVKNTLCKNG